MLFHYRDRLLVWTAEKLELAMRKDTLVGGFFCILIDQPTVF